MLGKRQHPTVDHNVPIKFCKQLPLNSVKSRIPGVPHISQPRQSDHMPSPFNEALSDVGHVSTLGCLAQKRSSPKIQVVLKSRTSFPS